MRADFCKKNHCVMASIFVMSIDRAVFRASLAYWPSWCGTAAAMPLGLFLAPPLRVSPSPFFLSLSPSLHFATLYPLRSPLQLHKRIEAAGVRDAEKLHSERLWIERMDKRTRAPAAKRHLVDSSSSSSPAAGKTHKMKTHSSSSEEEQKIPDRSKTRTE